MRDETLFRCAALLAATAQQHGRTTWTSNADTIRVADEFYAWLMGNMPDSWRIEQGLDDPPQQERNPR